MVRRIRIYFLGVLLGTLLVYVFVFRKHDIDWDGWLPGQRILRDIRNDEAFRSSDRVACLLGCRNLKGAVFIDILTEGKLLNLRPGGDPYRYAVLWSDSTGKEYRAEIEKTGLELELTRLHAGADTATCAQCP